jgi:hypothetical protein
MILHYQFLEDLEDLLLLEVQEDLVYLEDLEDMYNHDVLRDVLLDHKDSNSSVVISNYVHSYF